MVDKEPEPNQLFKFRWQGDKGSETVCARYDADRGKVVLIKAHSAYGIKPRNDEQKMALDALLNPKVKLVTLTGGAGTGKTLLALAAALEQENDFDQIYISRPAVILGNQDIGFLPGDKNTKMTPFLQPLMDNLNVIKGQFKASSREATHLEGLLRDEKLVIEPLAYIRGRSLGNAFFIIDEAQNLTPLEVKTIVTRAGEGTKIVLTGDIFQIDQPCSYALSFRSFDGTIAGQSRLIQKLLPAITANRAAALTAITKEFLHIGRLNACKFCLFHHHTSGFSSRPYSRIKAF